LYRDIVEVNPPLIFYVTVALSFATCTKVAYVCGVSLSILVSAAWCYRLRGLPFGALALGAMILGGFTDFGQRDHLALVFAMPFIAKRAGAPRGESVALGIWAFVGLGLKPIFLTVPALAILASCINARSIQPAWRLENFSLAAACVAYVGGAYALHPEYFT